MRRGWRPIIAGACVAAGAFALAQAQVFAPSFSAAKLGGGDPYRGETVFQRECAGCHGLGAVGGNPGPRLVGAGLVASTVADRISRGGGVMPAGIVSGQDEADVVAYVVSISSR